MPDIVFVHAPEPEHPGGGADVRVHALLEAIGRRFDTQLLTVGRGADIDADPVAMIRMAAAARGIPPRFSQRFDLRAQRAVARGLEGARVVVAETLFVLPYLSGIEAAIVLDAHNVESDVVDRLAQRESSRARRWAYAATASWSRRWEDKAAGRVDQVWAVSDSEAAWFRRSARDVVLVPNGVATPPSPLPPTPSPALIFVGSLLARFNRDGLRWFLDESWPIIRAAQPDARLHVVGAGSEDFHDEAVTTHGFVSNVETVYRKARVAIVPLLDGAGTRLKALEAMGLGKPVVSTSIGVDGIAVESGRDLLIGDEAQTFADACVRLLQDDDLVAQLSAAGRALVKRNYEWDSIAETAASGLRRLLA